MLCQEYECIEIPKKQYDLPNEAMKEMSTPHYTVEDFVGAQIEESLEKY